MSTALRTAASTGSSNPANFRDLTPGMGWTHSSRSSLAGSRRAAELMSPLPIASSIGGST